jgi:L-ascorbate metabolism protein UlaG (beta-lactamase superfamily)
MLKQVVGVALSVTGAFALGTGVVIGATPANPASPGTPAAPAAPVTPAPVNHQTDVIQTSAGPLKITPIFHASVMLEFQGKIIHVDPWSRGDFTGFPQADLILVTHTHWDHLDYDSLTALEKPTTIEVGSPAVADTVNGRYGIFQSLANGEKKTVMGIEIEAVPMYNLVGGFDPATPFHHKGVGDGYILTFGDTRVYFSGDTECVPEVKALRNITVAFIAMNAPRTMSLKEAQTCVEAIHPKIVYPYHYGKENTQQFADSLKGTGIEVRLRKLEGEKS